ncbi:c-type cytochrome [Tabrizicola oligotrophica]|uniref:Cytochrome c n=1 Tax=Tabrizicola oligotrophica TaxID=2710650 RepID=A0A6M0QUB4_9RHOB|nr:cytochrome c [Tabrizicola oligotrophica]NEY90052.1 cytochrome c [Tabrizicola oligotrophica]
MKISTTTLLVSALLMTGAAFAETEATTPEAIARQALMKSFGGAAKTLGGMASGEVAYDAAAAEAAKQVLVAGAATIEAKFTAKVEDAGSKAKPEIWTGWEAFLGKAKALGDAAGALDVASAESIGGGMGGVGGACKACHTDFRLAD